MEKVNCLFCNQAATGVFWKENGYLGHKCLNCGLIYISPRPKADRMEGLYAKGKAGGRSAEEQIRPSYIKDLYNRETLQLIKKYKPSGDLLELGASGGQFLTLARSGGFTPYALDINKELTDYLSEQLKIKTENCLAGSRRIFKGQKFDVIYHKDLLSHLRYPLRAFLNSRYKLRDDGMLIFETGNTGDLSLSWLKFIGRLSYPEHLYIFTDDNIRQLLKISGLKLIAKRQQVIVFSLLVRKFFYFVKEWLEILTGRGKELVRRGTPLRKAILKSEGLAGLYKVKEFLVYWIERIISPFLPASWPSRVIYIARKE